MAANKNPYRDGSAYAKVFDALRKAGQKGISRAELLESNAVADVTVVLSPRQEGVSTRGGDPRGNMSSQGHLYFVDKRKKEGEPARFVLRWRKSPLEKWVRAPKKDIDAQKSGKTAKAKTAKSKDAQTADATA
jgi:hypothetical protein